MDHPIIEPGKVPTTEEELEKVAKLLDSKEGRSLRRPGATLRRWASSAPSNIWIESKRGSYLRHSEEGFDCPVRGLYMDIRSYLDRISVEGGMEAYAVPKALEARLTERKMARRLPKPSTIKPKPFRF